MPIQSWTWIAKADNTIREITYYDRKGAALKRLPILILKRSMACLAEI